MTLAAPAVTLRLTKSEGNLVMHRGNAGQKRMVDIAQQRSLEVFVRNDVCVDRKAQCNGRVEWIESELSVRCIGGVAEIDDCG